MFKKTDKICKNCVWSEFGAIEDHRKCKYLPPVPVVRTGGKISSIWPLVHVCDYCSKWEKK